MRTHLRFTSLALAIVAAGCGGSKTNPTGQGQARLTVDLVDAPAAYRSVVVTVSKIAAHSSAAGWFTISDVPATIDLLTLKDTSFRFGTIETGAGKITQLRLYTDPDGPQFVTLEDGTQVELKVPSGPQSGIKIVGPFDLEACVETTITLDFDPAKSISVHPTEAGDVWILRPVIKAKKIVALSVGCLSDAPDAATDPGDAGTPDGFQEGLPGSACASPQACLSGVCSDGLCAKGGPGVPCQAPADCLSDTCEADGTCGNGNAVGTGSACTLPADCLSGVCADGLCDLGGQGAPCLAATDCAMNLVCRLGFCAPQVN